MPRAVSAPSSRMRRAVPPPAADSHANTPAVEAVAKAVTIRSSRTPPTCARSGSATAPIVPPIGTASWRQPSAMPRRSGGNWRSRLLMPATGTAEEPMPARKMAAANRAALGATEAAMYAQTCVGDRTHPLSDLRERATAGRDRRAGRRLGFGAAGRRAAGLRVRRGQAPRGGAVPAAGRRDVRLLARVDGRRSRAQLPARAAEDELRDPWQLDPASAPSPVPALRRRSLRRPADRDGRCLLHPHGG